MLGSLFVVALLCTGSLAFFFPVLPKIALTTAFSSVDDTGDDIIGLAPGILPAASPRTNFASHNPSIKHDVWIVGAGTLGELVIRGLRSESTAFKIIGETKTSEEQSAVTDLGAEHRARDARTREDEGSAKNVVICLPPSCAKDYTEEVHAATRLWAGPQGGGNLVFTSSIGVYGESSGNVVDETFRVDTRSASATRLLAAEEAVISRGGNVIRLAGLYTSTRGPHSYWLQRAMDLASTPEAAIIQGSATDVLNMLHYEDAASAVIALLHSTGHSGEVFLACDNEPVTKQEICQSALASGLYPGYPSPKFLSYTDPAGKVGKRCNSARTRKVLGWEPKHTSFRVFMRRLGGQNLPDVRVVEEEQKSTTPAEKSGLWIPGNDEYAL